MKGLLIKVLSALATMNLLGLGTVSAVTAARAPILVLAAPGGFGNYTGEILKAEGFNEFQMASPSDGGLTLGYLQAFNIVILAESSLTSVQADMFTNYVKMGGNLIAFRPGKQLAAVFGLLSTGTSLSEGCIKIDTNSEIGRGLSSETLQFHGEGDLYKLNGARSVATFCPDADTPTGSPAVVMKDFGQGHAIVFAYNLAKSIVYARQGNPQFAGQEKDGIEGIRAADMFTGGWVDVSKNSLNQADEQMRLLSHAIEMLSSHQKPLPRLWYFPDMNRSVVLLTSDGEDSHAEDFEVQFADLKSRGARMTLYLKGPYVPAGKVKEWVNDGFEISGHVDDTREAAHPTYKEMDSKVESTVKALKDAYGLDMHTVRNHWIVWCGENSQGQPDSAAQAAIEARHGIGLDCNLYHYDQGSNQGHFLGPVGNFTGSGLPMRFADARGNVLNIFGSLTQLPDEQWGQGNLARNFKTLLDRSLDNEGYSFINVNLHTDRWLAWSRPEGLEIVDYANSRSVPIWTARQALDFLEMRDAAKFENIVWSARQLSFQLQAPLTGGDLTSMVPRVSKEDTVTKITVNGSPQPFTLRTIKGTEYALATISSGRCKIVVTYGKEGRTKP